MKVVRYLGLLSHEDQHDRAPPLQPAQRPAKGIYWEACKSLEDFHVHAHLCHCTWQGMRLPRYGFWARNAQKMRAFTPNWKFVKKNKLQIDLVFWLHKSTDYFAHHLF